MAEIIYDNLTCREFVRAERTQIKMEHRAELPEDAKKVVNVSATVYPKTTEASGDDVTVGGRTVIRIVYMNEFDKYDSKEVVEDFEKKVFIKDISGLTSIQSTLTLMDSRWTAEEGGAVKVANIIDINIYGVSETAAQIVSDLHGEVEVQKTDNKVLAFNGTVSDRFDTEDSIDLDKNCEGVLGVDANAFVRDISCGDGKVVVKGIVAANVLGVKTAEDGSVPYNSVYDVDFVKTVTAPGVTADDLAGGTVTVSGVTVKIENGGSGAVLALTVGLAFNGTTFVYKKWSTVTDAISFDKELSFETKEMEQTGMVPQINTAVEVENNINLPEGTAYIAKVLSVDGAKIVGLSAGAKDGKVLIEGIITANVLIENEEHAVYNYTAEAPFQTSARADNIDDTAAVTASVIPLTFNVKARRGVELLVDSKLGISVIATNKKTAAAVTSVIVGKDKAEDGSAIRIYIVGDKENLWDIAKRTNLASAELIRQNPNLENGCSAGDRVVVYRHETVNL